MDAETIKELNTRAPVPSKSGATFGEVLDPGKIRD
jgi:hypothetical protein